LDLPLCNMLNELYIYMYIYIYIHMYVYMYVFVTFILISILVLYNVLLTSTDILLVYITTYSEFRELSYIS